LAELAAVLAGIALTCALLYISRRNDPSPPLKGSGETPARSLSDKDVASSFYFCFAALTSSAISYASLIDDNIAPYRLGAGLILHGVALGNSVLALFYSTALMLHENSPTRRSAFAAYRVVLVLGPVVAMRFVAGSSYDLWRALKPAARSSLTPATVGMAVAALLMCVAIVALTVGALDTQHIKGIRKRIAERPNLPSVIAFGVSVLTTVSSLYLSTWGPKHNPSSNVAWFAITMGAAAFIVFSITCGLILGHHAAGQALHLTSIATTAVPPPGQRAGDNAIGRTEKVEP
jgi:hypothetical protein